MFLCRELVFLAEARRRNGASRDELRPLVEEACAIAEPIGARVVNVDVERYGLRLTRIRAAVRTRHGWREHRIGG